MRLMLTSLLFASCLAGPAGAVSTPLQAYVAGDYSLAIKDYSSASRYLGAALAAAPDDVVLQRRAFEIALTAGNFDRAVRFAQDIALRDENISSVNQVLAVDAVRRRDWATASKVIARMPEVGIDALLVPLLRCWTAAGAGDIASARTALDKLDGNGSFSSFKAHQLAWLAVVARDWPAAQTSFGILIAAPESAGSANLIGAAFVQLQMGKPDDARALFSKLDPRRSSFASLDARDMLLKAGKLQSPVNSVQEGLATALSVLSAELARDDIRGASVNLAQLAAWLAPAMPEMQMILSDVLTAADRTREALQVLDRQPPQLAGRIDMLEARTRVLTQMDRTADASALLEKAAAQHPERLDLLMLLGDSYRTSEKYEQAAATYTRAIHSLETPYTAQDWALFFARGVAHERLKKWDLSEADLRQALALRPDDASLLNYLGYSWLEQKRNLEQAGQMIARALEQRPGDGAIIDSLGWSYFLKGDYKQAIDLLEQALAAVPGDPTVNEHLGDAYAAVGRIIEARHRWQAALESEPDAAQQQRLAGKLDGGSGAPGPMSLPS